MNPIAHGTPKEEVRNLGLQMLHSCHSRSSEENRKCISEKIARLIGTCKNSIPENWFFYLHLLEVFELKEKFPYSAQEKFKAIVKKKMPISDREFIVIKPITDRLWKEFGMDPVSPPSLKNLCLARLKSLPSELPEELRDAHNRVLKQRFQNAVLSIQKTSPARSRLKLPAHISSRRCESTRSPLLPAPASLS